MDNSLITYYVRKDESVFTKKWSYIVLKVNKSFVTVKLKVIFVCASRSCLVVKNAIIS